MGSSDFVAFLGERRPQVEAWISSSRWRAAGPVADDLSRYLYGPLAHYNEGGGKRVRPVLALLGAEAIAGAAATTGPVHEAALAAGGAVELFQSAALIHDDIADEGELRRGEPCLHRTLGEGLAINIGDAALVEAGEALMQAPGLDDATRLSLMRELLSMERRTLEGQALDLGWVRDGRWDVTPDEYRAMATLKTAHYSCATPLVLGALCAGATEAQVTCLRAFGLAAGLAFQIQDDLLNLVGDPAAQGKDFRTDITEGKRTLVVVTALGQLAGPARDELVGLLSGHVDDPAPLARAVDLMEGCGAIAAAKAEALALVAQAKAELSGAALSPGAAKTLQAMADFFVERLG